MLIRSTDDGAPSLTGETGSLYAVLKWALPQLGWTVEFDNGSDVVVFRNDGATGTGDYLRIDDNPANHDGVDARLANVRSYAAMVDIDTGADVVGDSGWMLTKSSTADNTPRAWAVIGDERYFWLLTDTSGTDNYAEIYLGDIESDKPGDSGMFLTQSSSNLDPSGSSVIVPQANYGSSLSGNSQVRYSLDGQSTGVSVRYTPENRSGSTGTVSGAPGSSGPYPEPASGGIRVVDIVVQEDTGGIIRGRLRGGMRIMNDVVGEFATWQAIENQSTGRGPRDCVIVNRYARLASTSNAGVLLFDHEHEGAW
jgi:hypothetical protein